MDVILVNEADEPVGVMEKMEVHRKALLHRAFSIFIFNSKGEMLLQRRALDKYHSAGLWSNSCCSHPQPGEETIDSASRRLKEELGIETTLKHVFHFIYKAEFDNQLTEHELDHVFIGNYDGEIVPNPEEVNDYTFNSIDEVLMSMDQHPEKYTAWFKIIMPRVADHLRKNTSI